MINEIMSSNISYLLDQDGDASDWIELYNPTNSDINLMKYQLSDEAENLTMWQFPDITLGPKEFLTVFASDKDRAIANMELHTNFKIKATGEELFLSYDGLLVQTVPAVELGDNKSYGLHSDGNAPFVVFTNPSPFGSNNFSVVSHSIYFSKVGGVYEEAFPLSITTDLPGNKIYYTTDGTTPSSTSFLYSTPLTLDENLFSTANISQLQISTDDRHDPPQVSSVLKAIVIRAAIFDLEDNQISEIATNSYFIKELGIDHSALPIVSITANYDDLFSHETGIFVPGIHYNEVDPNWTGNYYQRGKEWEREVHIEFYEGENSGFKQNAGLRAHGGNSRKYPQKGMKLYARSDYGDSRFEYPLFPDSPMESFKRLTLKPFSSSWTKSGIEDYISGNIARTMDVEAAPSKPVVLYLNGEYWGIYFLQERIGRWFFADNYGVHEDSVNIVNGWWGEIVEGDNQDFIDLYEYINTEDLEIQSNYEVIDKWIDIDNFIDYQFLEIFIANYDWPNNNMKCWKPQKEGAKWRWIFYDGDAALRSTEKDSYDHALDTGSDPWPTNATSTLFLRKLLANPTFHAKFFSRAEYLLNNQLSNSLTRNYHEQVVEDIRWEVLNQIDRFHAPLDHAAWTAKVTNCSNFLNLRSCIIQELTEERYNKNFALDECITDFELSDITSTSIFPNPNNGEFTIELTSSSNFTGTLHITNLLGQSFKSIGCTIFEGKNRIAVSETDLPKGILFVSLSSEKETLSMKMLCVGE